MSVELIIQNIPLIDIHADDNFNCRGAIAPIDVVDLANDIAKNGLLQPVIIAPYNDSQIKETGKKYKLIAGFRRFTAFKVNKQSTIPAVVRADLSNDVDALYLNLSENTQRKDLNVLQEAKALQKLMDLGVGEFEAADRLGKSRGWIQVRYMLLRLPQEIQQECAAGIVSQTHIRELYTILGHQGKDKVLEACKRIKESKERNESKPITVNPSMTNIHIKKHRKRAEIFMLLNHVIDAIGPGIHSKMLAWCAGELTTIEIFEVMRQYAEEKGITYVMPKTLGE